MSIQHVGPFELREVIGQGGMGEVWRARDTRLERDVALKTLPARFAVDSSAAEQLAREARLLASLNHPNIAAILGLEEHRGHFWLVLELIEGPTLEEHLAAGPLAPREAIDIALQVCDALQAAHSRGIVHCDLKPSNIKLSADGIVKVLDFGIARSLRIPAHDPHTTVTVESGFEVGNAGTPAYMSPEQARGEAVGPTTDIWAIGVLLYRMLAGRLPFVGPSNADVLAQVLQTSPDLSPLENQVPPSLVRLLARCLEKDPRRRIQHAGDLRFLLEESLVPSQTGVGAERTHGKTWRIAAPALIALAALGVLAWWTMQGNDDSARRGPVRAELVFERGGANARPYGSRQIAITRDGSRIALANNSALWIRSLDAAQPVSMNIDCVNPFFSPDGAWVGCFNERSGLMKIPAGGGPPVTLSRILERTAGAAWSSDGSIIVATSAGLFRVSDAGGEPELIVRPDASRGERQYAWPEFLPGERALLLTVLDHDRDAQPRLARLDLGSRTIAEVLKGGSSPHYVAGGVLLYASGSRLYATRFDATSGSVRGQPLPVPDLSIDVSADNGAASYSVATNGTLVALRPQPSRSDRVTLHWRDARGVEKALNLPPGHYSYPRVSPDGSHVALVIRDSNSRDIWSYDVARGSLARVTTDPGEDLLPEWSPDGQRIYFSSNRGGNLDIYSQPADGSQAARKELAAPGEQIIVDITPDGRSILAVEDFRRLSLFQPATGSSQPLLQEGAVYWNGSVSPDGKWIAYESSEAGEQMEIFVRPFPRVSERRERVSTSGGRFPVWGPRGSNALYFQQQDGAMMRAELRLHPDLQVGSVMRLFDGDPPLPRISGVPYDISPKDGRFLLYRFAAEEPDRLTAELVIDWFEELRRLVPESS